jgi:radical SAM protein with 4Fe4S-binding SPASM domain
MGTTTRIDLKELLSPLKFLPLYAERSRGDAAVLPPLAVELHWTSTCNYNCVHCSYGSRRQTKGSLSSTVIKPLVKDLIDLGTEAVYLSGGGEPTTFPNWAGYALELLAGGIEVALITNGVAVRQEHLAVLRRMNYIAVSVYSTDEKEYRTITGGGAFQKQFALPSLLGEAPSDTVVGARCVLNSINYRSVSRIYRQAISAGFAYIIFIPAVDYEKRKVALQDAEIAEVEKILRQDYGLFDLSKTNLDVLLKRGVSHYFAADYREGLAVPPAHCSAISIRGNAFVNFDGGVYLCQPDIGDETYAIGNLNRTGFREMWNSTRHRDIIDRLDARFAQGLCRNCRSIAFNRAAALQAGEKSNLTSIRRDPFI